MIYAGTTSNLYNIIRLYFNDYIFNKSTGSVSLHLMPIANRKFNLKWVLEDDDGESFYEEWETIPEFIDGFSVPYNVILVKVE